ncbi:MAG: lysine-sensitive aspartokinase 3, partial [Gemmatimonadales bacterium]
MIVVKFGGTSVADAGAIGRLIDIVRGRLERRPLVVVSALAGVTDALLVIGRLVAGGDREAAKAAILALVERHMGVADGLPGARDAGERVLADGAKLLNELGPAFGRPLSGMELDALTGRGEMWSAQLVTAA